MSLLETPKTGFVASMEAHTMNQTARVVSVSILVKVLSMKIHLQMKMLATLSFMAFANT